ncbi:nucleotidyltransferase domain-containing protein [Paraburkholderia sp. HP33-1]|uniref:nucleotidyltransferase domain-containing protein n=1 Tax=Paraburkholderia sp. HP33-1 TaxID=2883243 RepID=UPI001F3939ED|nr:nucleotidyltransferase domain-containing protein [Paraburkholderia sp. HP33-1]
MSDSQIFEALCAELQSTYHCHTAILYGSRARGDYDATSDLDVIAFRHTGGQLRIAAPWNGMFLDLFVHATDDEAEPGWIRIHGGRVLFQQDTFGDQVLARVQAQYEAGPAAISMTEIAFRKAWSEKMLRRAGKGDAEGDYRRHWLLFSLLENYLEVRGLWYLGPKQALRTLADIDTAHSEVFKRALSPCAPLEAIQEAVAVTFGCA